MISVLRRAGATYPDSRHAFSPHENYPEYRLSAIAPSENRVYEMVREVFRQADLDAERYGSADWNPLGGWIRPGSKVFVLCNFVYHRRPQESEHAFQAKTTHGSVLRALVDYVLLAAGDGGKVWFGNAPLQSCRWERVLADSGAGALQNFYRHVGAPVEGMDLRWEVVERDALGRVTGRDVRAGETPTVEIDLGSESLLEEVTSREAAGNDFRVSDYNPDRTREFHGRGVHRYVIHRAVLDCDVVVSLPKLKTHEKVGITCAVKGFVGAVARKDCLAHHRFGSPSIGGDEYPRSLAFLHPLSRFHDWVNRRPQDAAAQPIAQVVDRSARRIVRRLGADGAGAWHGNDTAWRMAVDLARILHYADVGGVLGSTPQRRHLALIDGIVAGEGNGPLSPRAVDAAALVFSDGVLDADRAACRLMGFDPEDVRMIREGARLSRHALDPASGPSDRTVFDGVSIPSESLPPALGRSFDPPRGWRGHLGRKS